MTFDMYLDPDYAQLIIDVNKLKIEVAEKIVERNWLSVHLYPEIKNNYNLKLGVNEAELFLAKMNLEKIKRKISIYEEYLKYGNEIDEQKIDLLLNKEFKTQIHEYTLMQEEIKESVEQTHKDVLTENEFGYLNDLYKRLILKLCPLLNLKNTRLENDLYDELEEAYKKSNLEKMVHIYNMCEYYEINKDLEIDDFDSMKKQKNIYQKLLEENKCIILNIRTSEMFSNRTLLENEILLRRKKEDINEKIKSISEEYSSLLKDLEKLKKKK